MSFTIVSDTEKKQKWIYVMNGNHYLNTQLARELLFKVGEKLATQNIIAEIALYGGSSLLFTIDGRESTKDIDYLMIGDAPAELSLIASEVGSEYGLTQAWFSDVTAVITSDHPEYMFLGDFPPERPGLRVFSATPEYVLAMKMRHMRSSLEGNDVKDIWMLLDHCDIKDVDQAMAWFQKFFPHEEINPRNEAIMHDIITSKTAGEEYSPMIGW